MEEGKHTRSVHVIKLSEEGTTGDFNGFANALSVWINKPHVVNRRLCGSKFRLVLVNSKSQLETLNVDNVIRSLYNEGDESSSNVDTPDHNYVPQEIEGLADFTDDDAVIVVREMLPKQPEKYPNIPELIIFDKLESSCTFCPLKLSTEDGRDTDGPDEKRQKTSQQIEVVYKFMYKANPNRIELYTNSEDYSLDSDRTMSLTWLKGQLLKKLSRWSEEPALKTSLSSLKLLPLEEYNLLYYKLKERYGLHFAKIWPERTDPQKFVFEDVAIATYLLLLWKKDAEVKNLTTKQSFVDLGCGNGLLVHILASEGHPGYGVDIRRRNIWDLYGPETVLKEQSITPSTESLFPETDWLIGNHSDELTPWIPVMAARSSYTCNYFVLPCCHFDFDSRFKVKGPGTSQYRTYLDYVKCVGEKCGFNIEEDMLRIPSTKRICFIGRSRTYLASREKEVDEQRTQYISSRCSHDNNSQSVDTDPECPVTDGQDNSDSTVKWASEFKPRAKEEIVRNCVTVRTEVKEHVVKTVFETLMKADNCEVRMLASGRQWNKGGKIPMSDVASLFDKSILSELKSECGGLQTMLRNYSSVFQVSGGEVQLRDFTLSDPWGKRRNGKGKGKTRDVEDKLKTSMCWFNENHPNGCPLSTDTCSYAHSSEELRTVKRK